MPPNKHSIRIWISLHSLLQLLRQILLMGRILNDRNDQFIIITQTPLLPPSLANPLDLLQMLNFKAGLLAMLPLYEQRDEDSPL